LSATLFLEFTDEASMREWLPRLIGIERAVQLHIGNRVVSCQPEEEHADMLTRSDVTSSVHYIRFPLDAQDVAALRDSTLRNSALQENGSGNEAVSHKMTRHGLPGSSESGGESGSQGGSKSEDKGEGGSQSGSESGDESGSQSGSETASSVASDPASVVALAVDHPAYKASTLLTGETVEELLGDLEGHPHQ